MSLAVRPEQDTTVVRRPWGWWQVLDEGAGYKVKRITVDAGARLSLQTHRHRSEHWFVVAGEATCVVGERQVVLREGDSIDVRRGVRHRIGNAGTHQLLLVEVQLGAYTGEDDIVRLQDDYGR
jgi:mannose-6-phosphate isomerase